MPLDTLTKANRVRNLPYWCIGLGVGNPPLLLFQHLEDRGPDISPHDQACSSLPPLHLVFLPSRDSYVLLTQPLRLLDQHLMLFERPYILPSLDILPDCLRACDMMGALQDHRLEENAPLCIEAALLDPSELRQQRLDKIPPQLPPDTL